MVELSRWIRMNRQRSKLKQTSLDAINAVLRFGLHIAPSEKLALWWGYRYRPAPALAKLRSGQIVEITENDHLQLLLYYCGEFEPQCVELMKKHIGPGSIVLDVGANIGLYTLEAAKAVGATGRVIAIEASPGHISTIGKSVGLNGFQNVDIISSAVGDVEGMTTLTLPEGANHGMFTLGSVAGSVTMRVNAKRIDDILDEQKALSVDFIKMDIEGSELVALKGATQTLKRFRPTILIELNEAALRSCGTSSFEVKSLLYSMDYKGSIVGTSGLMPIPSGQIIHECDECLFIPNRADTV